MEVYQVLVSAGKAWLPKRCGGGALKGVVGNV